MTVPPLQFTPKVFIAVPSGRQLIAGQTTSTLLPLALNLMMQNMYGGFGTLAFPDIAELRSIFLTVWYDKIQTSHLLFIDDDMGFGPQLVFDMLALDKPVVGCLCPKRKFPIEFAGRAKPGDCRIVNGFMEVEGVGGAILLIRRDAIDAILDKFPDIVDEKSLANHAAKDLFQAHGMTRIIKAFKKMWIDGEEFSEDLSFSFRWREAAPDQYRQGTSDGKGELWANIAHEVTHVGPQEFTGKYVDMIKDFIKPSGEAVKTDGAAQPAHSVALDTIASMIAAE